MGPAPTAKTLVNYRFVTGSQFKMPVVVKVNSLRCKDKDGAQLLECLQRMHKAFESWHTLVTPISQKVEQEDHKFKAILSYIMSLKLARTI